MRLAETVTFGGSGLDRAATRRTQARGLKAAMTEPGAKILPLWRGKPLFAGDTRAPGFLSHDHPLLEDHGGTWVFLGQEAATDYFAIDVSRWEPEEMPDTMGAFLDPSEQRHPDLPSTHVFAELRMVLAEMDTRTAELAATAKALLGWHASHEFCARCGAASEPAQAGWQRDCPACGTHHFPRTDPVVIMLITEGNDVLVGRSPGWPEGMYSLLAGFVEPGETLEAAVRREVVEESGVIVGNVGYLASQPWPFPASLMLGMWGHAKSREIKIDPEEIEDAIWVSREEMVKALAGRHDMLKPARNGSIAHFLLTHWVRDSLG